MREFHELLVRNIYFKCNSILISNRHSVNIKKIRGSQLERGGGGVGCVLAGGPLRKFFVVNWRLYVPGNLCSADGTLLALAETLLQAPSAEDVAANCGQQLHTLTSNAKHLNSRQQLHTVNIKRLTPCPYLNSRQQLNTLYIKRLTP